MPLTVSELRIHLNLFVMNFTLCPVLLFGTRPLCEKYSPRFRELPLFPGISWILALLNVSFHFTEEVTD